MITQLRAAATLFVFGLMASVTPGVAATVSATASTYTERVVGPFSHVGREALALNSAGHMTGQSRGNQAFYYDGALHLLGKPAGSMWSVGQGISNGDVIAATAQNSHGIRTAYVVRYSNGRATWSPLPGLPGFRQSEVSAILPDGSAIAGTLCLTGARACGARKPTLAVVWKRSGGKYHTLIVLPSAGKGSFANSTSGIARDSNIIVVSGSITSLSRPGGAQGVWVLHGHRILGLTGPDGYTVGYPFGVAHGSGNTFYVAGQLSNPNIGTVTEGAVWMIHCTAKQCRQTGRQILTTFGEVFGVNSHGAAVGYSRPNGDGAGFNFVWQEGRLIQIEPTPYAINNAGQIAGWRPNYSLHHAEVVLLTRVS